MVINIDEYINKINNFPSNGILFYDISPLMANPAAWNYTLDKMIDMIRDLKIDKLAAIESRGFLLASALSIKLNIGFVLIRKKGKLPGDIISEDYKLEYGNDSLEIQKNAINPNERVLIIDDVLATGGTIGASYSLLKKCDANVVGTLFLIELLSLNGSKNIDIPCYSLLKY